MSLYDRSRSTTDWQCPRRRYWTYEHLGRGIVPDITLMALYMGTAIHDGLAAIAHFHKDKDEVDIDLIATTAQKQMYDALIETDDSFENMQFANEQSRLVEGMLRGFYRQVWPGLMQSYPNILAIEQEMTYIHDNNGLKSEKGPHCFMAKPDLVIGNDNGDNFYIEYKSTSTKKPDWIHSWDTAIQLHSTCKAIEATLNIPVTGVIVQGLYKGYSSYGKQSSPFCYAYHRPGEPPFIKEQTSYAYKAGFKKYPTWELEGGLKKWVENMPEDMLADQFPQTPPIFIKEDIVQAFFAQRGLRETEIDMAMEMLKASNGDEEVVKAILNTAFPQKFDQCSPAFGSLCPDKVLCHGCISDPLTSGFQLRESHHQLEADKHAKKV